MKKLFLGTLGAGALAAMLALGGAFSPACAQDVAAQPGDRAAAVILCSARVETNALTCKKKTLSELADCLDNATGTADQSQCDKAALAALGRCQAISLRGDLICYLDPNSAPPPVNQ